MRQEDHKQLYSDAPLDDPTADKLGFRRFAADKAAQIYNEMPAGEFIVGINGPWGSGKSTIVNFIEKELKQKDDPPTVLRFNPWWFSDEADLIEKFLSQLSTTLERYDDIDELRSQIAAYAHAFSQLPLSSFGFPIDKVAKSAEEFLDSEPPNINELYDEIAGHLVEYDDDIVVIIDDIDRLPPDNIRHMIRVMKSVAAFPSITYVVAFDKEAVTEALEGYEGVSEGEAYLQKIIQLPIDVPLPQEGTLHRFLSERLNKILYESDTTFERSRWEGAYQDGIRPLVATPRDAIRLSNAVRASIRGIESEINFVDLVCLEALRLYSQPLYEDIKTNKDMYSLVESVGEPSPNYLNNFFNDNISSNVKPKEVLLSYLFPSVDTHYSHTINNEFTTDGRKYYERNRICNPKNFSIYFRQSIGQAELTENIFEEGIQETDYLDSFIRFLKKESTQRGPTGRSRAYNFLAELRDRYDECLDPANTVIALLTIGDELALNDPPHNQVEAGAEEFVVEIVGRLIATQEPSDRFNLLQEAVRQAESPYVMVDLIDRIDEGAHFGADDLDRHENLCTPNQRRELKQAACEKIFDAAQSGDLFDAPHLHETIEAWVSWDRTSRYETWSKQGLKTAAEIEDLLDGLLETGQIYNTGKSKEVEYLDPEWLTPLVAPERALDTITANGGTTETEHTEKLVTILKQGLEIRNKGGDPTKVEKWDE